MLLNHDDYYYIKINHDDDLILTPYCTGGSYVTANGGCESCPMGYYSKGTADTMCIKCPLFRVGTISSGCKGLDTTQMKDGNEDCTCDGFMTGIPSNVASGIITAMMCTYFLLVLYFMRKVVSLNSGVSKFSLLQLALTVMLSALDTTTDLLYILVNPFSDSIFFGLIIFFYLVNILTYINYLRVTKPGLIASLVTVPPTIASSSSKFTLLLLVPYYTFILVKSLTLLFIGYLLYTSKLIVLAPIHNNFMFWFAQSNNFQTTQLVDNEHFSESIYYELFFESTPQIILQVLNWGSTSFGGSVVEVNKLLFISIISSGFVLLYHSQKLVRTKLSCQKVADIKTGFEGLNFTEVDLKPDVEELSIESNFKSPTTLPESINSL